MEDQNTPSINLEEGLRGAALMSELLRTPELAPLTTHLTRRLIDYEPSSSKLVNLPIPRLHQIHDAARLNRYASNSTSTPPSGEYPMPCTMSQLAQPSFLRLYACHCGHGSSDKSLELSRMRLIEALLSYSA